MTSWLHLVFQSIAAALTGDVAHVPCDQLGAARNTARNRLDQKETDQGRLSALALALPHADPKFQFVLRRHDFLTRPTLCALKHSYTKKGDNILTTPQYYVAIATCFLLRSPTRETTNARLPVINTTYPTLQPPVADLSLFALGFDQTGGPAWAFSQCSSALCSRGWRLPFSRLVC
jgi:hypothetical protein